jgi:glycosyltransferase involved in cell wall biosynthesis
VVATFHGTVDVSSSERFQRLKFAILNLAVDRFVTVSDSLRISLETAGLSRDGRTMAIYNGVNLSKYEIPRHRRIIEELQLPEDAILIGSLGNVRPAKAYDVLIRAAARLCPENPRVYFLVAGHINERVFRPLKDLLSEHSLERRVRFLGFRSDTAAFLKGLDAFVLSSSSEGFSIATVEAQAAGLPIVATRSGGPEEIIEDGVTGLLVPVNHPQALAEGVDQILRDRALAERLGVAARRAAADRFSVEAMIEAYAQIYRGLIRK